jgi:hypothetical protein
VKFHDCHADIFTIIASFAAAALLWFPAEPVLLQNVSSTAPPAEA